MQTPKEIKIRRSGAQMERKYKKKSCIKYNSFLTKKWSHLGLNQGPPDYESDALTN